MASKKRKKQVVAQVISTAEIPVDGNLPAEWGLFAIPLYGRKYVPNFK